jgi:hypothetical protein
MAKLEARGDNFRDAIISVTRIAFLAFKSQVGLRRCSMKTAFVISALALIAIGAAVFSSTKANAEDAFSGGVPRYIRPYPVAPSAAPPERAYYHRPYHHHRRYN